MKHQGTVQTDVYYPISSFVFDDLKYNFESEKNGLKIVNFGWGKNNTYNLILNRRTIQS